MLVKHEIETKIRERHTKTSRCAQNFPGMNTGIGVPFPSPGYLSDPDFEAGSLMSPAFVGGYLPLIKLHVFQYSTSLRILNIIPGKPHV